MAGLLSKSIVFFIALVVCFISTSAELKRLEHSTKVDGSLSFLVVGDWGRRGAYNQSQVALQVVCQSQHQGRPMSILDAVIDLSGRSQLLMVHWIPNFSQMGRIGEKLDIDFVISTGDNFYDDGLTGINDVAFLESFSNIYTAKSLQTNWYSVLGNHDYRGDVEAQTSHVLRKIDSRWFCLRSFLLDAEIAEFFFVDTTPFVDKYFTHSEEQEHTYDWRGVNPRNKYLPRLLKDVESALRESTAKWKIVVGHHTIRSISQHGDTAELVEKLLPILQAYDVDFYMNGHDHCLEHIRSTNSPLQFLTSGGGSKAWRGDIKGLDQDGVEFFYDGQGFMSVQLNKNAAKFQFYDVGGKVLHSWNIFKQLHSSV